MAMMAMIERIMWLQLQHQLEPARGWDRVAAGWWARMEREAAQLPRTRAQVHGL